MPSCEPSRPCWPKAPARPTWVARRAPPTWAARSPATSPRPADPRADGRAFDRIARGSPDDIDRAVQAAQAAMGAQFDGPWAMTCARDRGRLLAAWGRAVLAEADDLARLEARDTGKTLRTARNDVTALARYFEYYAGAC